MPFRLMPALCVLLLAGCASSEPQNASYAPACRRRRVRCRPRRAAQRCQLALRPCRLLRSVAMSFYRPQTGRVLPNEADDTPPQPVAPAQRHHCSTVDGVTLCDAPADSGTDNSSGRLQR